MRCISLNQHYFQMTLRGPFLRWTKDIYYFEGQIIVISKMISGLLQKSSSLWGKTFFILCNALCSVEAKWNKGESQIFIGPIEEKQTSIAVCRLGLLLKTVPWSNTIWIKPRLYFTFSHISNQGPISLRH